MCRTTGARPTPAQGLEVFFDVANLIQLRAAARKLYGIGESVAGW
jgi:hypothetical protein